MNNDTAHLFALYCENLHQLVGTTAAPTVFTLSEPTLVHRIVHVLRLREEQPLILFDRQQYVVGAIEQMQGKKTLRIIAREIHPTNIFNPSITLLLPLLKKEALETALYNAVELGVSHIVLVSTAKSRTQLQGTHELERNTKIMIAAAEQAKHFAFPRLHQPQKLQDVLQSLPALYTGIVCTPEGITMPTVLEMIKKSDAPLFLTLKMYRRRFYSRRICSSCTPFFYYLRTHRNNTTFTTSARRCLGNHAIVYTIKRTHMKITHIVIGVFLALLLTIPLVYIIKKRKETPLIPTTPTQQTTPEPTAPATEQAPQTNAEKKLEPEATAPSEPQVTAPVAATPEVAEAHIMPEFKLPEAKQPANEDVTAKEVIRIIHPLLTAHSVEKAVETIVELNPSPDVARDVVKRIIKSTELSLEDKSQFILGVASAFEKKLTNDDVFLSIFNRCPNEKELILSFLLPQKENTLPRFRQLPTG